MSDTLVHVNQGTLKGKVCTTINNYQFLAFKGIPYAKPPIGELRFAVSHIYYINYLLS